jgi:hypothetical protein
MMGASTGMEHAAITASLNALEGASAGTGLEAQVLDIVGGIIRTAGPQHADEASVRTFEQAQARDLQALRALVERLAAAERESDREARTARNAKSALHALAGTLGARIDSEDSHSDALAQSIRERFFDLETRLQSTREELCTLRAQTLAGG